MLLFYRNRSLDCLYCVELSMCIGMCLSKKWRIHKTVPYIILYTTYEAQWNELKAFFAIHINLSGNIRRGNAKKEKKNEKEKTKSFVVFQNIHFKRNVASTYIVKRGKEPVKSAVLVEMSMSNISKKKFTIVIY